MPHRYLAAALCALLPALSPLCLAADAAQLARGEYLAKFGGCGDCHTPLRMGDKGPEPDMTRTFSGHPQDMQLPPPPAASGPWIWGGAASMTAFHGPWGISYAANLTPDVETGLGSWTLDDFTRAMRQGLHRGAGRPLVPPMPWQSVAALDDADLAALFAWLFSLPPVHNRVPDYQPPAP